MLKTHLGLIAISLAFALKTGLASDELAGFQSTLRVSNSPTSKSFIFDNLNGEFPIYSRRDQKTDPPSYIVKIRGKTADPDYTAVFETKELNADSDGWMNLEIELKAPEQPFSIKVVNEHGDLSDIEGVIEAPNWPEMTGTEKPKKYNFALGFGPSLKSYRQTLVNSFSQGGISVAGSGEYSFPKEVWKVGLVFGLNSIPASSSTSDRMSTLKIGIYGSYLVQFLSLPKLNLRLGGGYSYLTSIVTSTKFGFQNVGGLTLFPRAEYKFKESQILFAQIRYTPLFTANPVLSLNNFEVGTEIGYCFPVRIAKKRQYFSVKAEFLFFQLSDSTSKILMSDTIVGLSYHFGV